MTTVYLAWRDPGRRWFPVGVLTQDANGFSFSYTHGAEDAVRGGGFQPLPAFPNLNEPYRSPTLFSVFSNRVLSEKRPEFREFVTWLNMEPGTRVDTLVLLTVSAGRRETDTFEVFARPEPDAEHRYRVHCFVHGLQHRSPTAIERAAHLATGEELRVEPEPTNDYDQLAVKTLTTGDVQHIGYLPRYLTEDVHTLGVGQLDVRVERINPPPAPLQFRVLCSVTAPWPAGFRACATPQFQPISTSPPEPQRAIG